jgi:4-hydroxy-3-polyprenylbenzoate decarboxylase
MASDNLLNRAADAALKERRRLVLAVRETPLSFIHLIAMQLVTEAAGIIAPPVPAFHIRPERIDDIIDYTVVRALDLFDIVVEDRIKRGQGLGCVRTDES